MAELDPTQAQTLKTDITVTNAGVNWEGDTLGNHYDMGNDDIVARYYNAPDDGGLEVWKEDFALEEALAAIDGGEFNGLQENKVRTWNSLIANRARGNNGTLDVAKQEARDKFAAVFSAGSQPLSFNGLLAAGGRLGTRAEILYSTAVQGKRVTDIYGQLITGNNISATRSI